MGTVVAVVVAVILGYGVGVFASSNIILPLLWAWPKARRLYREGMLTRPIPTWRFLIPFFIWGLLVLGSLWLAGVFPSFSWGYTLEFHRPLSADFRRIRVRPFQAPRNMARCVVATARPSRPPWVTASDSCDTPKAGRRSASRSARTSTAATSRALRWALGIPP